LKGNALGVVPRRHGNNAAVLFVVLQQKQPRQGATRLKSTGVLKVFVFNNDRCTEAA
jgi:hypothetical protein